MVEPFGEDPLTADAAVQVQSRIRVGLNVLDMEVHLLVMESDFTSIDERTVQILLFFLVIDVACTRGWIFDSLLKRDLLDLCLHRICLTFLRP